ncbi:MAG TPA: hypothetical protein VFN87_02825 [Solirubrobacteraceae bacterium]|nr:hypothetical protein [Solirubrobacteraceae bacterium]
MSELGGFASNAAGAVAIGLLLVLLAEHEILRLVSSPRMRRARSALMIAIVPLLVVFVLVGVLRLADIAFTHP